jgi:hypothetical protein
MLKIHETTNANGGLSPVFLRADEGTLMLITDKGTFALPEGALASVMKRFGAPLDPGAEISVIASLDLAPGSSLRHARHLSAYDVIARDYLVYASTDGEPLCALATTVAGALDHLAKAAEARRRAAASR